MNLGGRPREYDLDQLADELLLWSTNPTSLNLIGFTRPKLINVTRLADWAKENSRFSDALQLAKQSIAQNRFEAALSGEMPQVMHARCEGLYDPLYHKYSRSEKEFESSLRKKENEHHSGDVYVIANPKLASGADIRAKRLSNESDNSPE